MISGRTVYQTENPFRHFMKHRCILNIKQTISSDVLWRRIHRYCDIIVIHDEHIQLTLPSFLYLSGCGVFR